MRRRPKSFNLTDITAGGVNWARVPGCKRTHEEHLGSKLINGDIVVARTGGTVGKSFLISTPPDAVCASYLLRLRPNASIERHLRRTDANGLPLRRPTPPNKRFSAMHGVITKSASLEQSGTKTAMASLATPHFFEFSMTMARASFSPHMTQRCNTKINPGRSLRKQVRPGLRAHQIPAGRMHREPAVRDCGFDRPAHSSALPPAAMNCSLTTATGMIGFHRVRQFASSSMITLGS